MLTSISSNSGPRAYKHSPTFDSLRKKAFFMFLRGFVCLNQIIGLSDVEILQYILCMKPGWDSETV